MILKVALLQILPGNGLTEQFHIGEEALRRAKDAGADLALFPEMWSTGYEIPPDEDVLGRMAVSADGNFIKKFGWLAKNLEMAIGITFLEKHSPRPKNSIALYDRHGERKLLYSKVHTCEFGDERLLSAGDDFYALLPLLWPLPASPAPSFRYKPAAAFPCPCLPGMPGIVRSLRVPLPYRLKRPPGGRLLPGNP